MIKVMIIGTLPPPMGGVTIHIERLYKKNLNLKSIDLSVADIRNRIFYFKGREYGIFKSILEFFKANIIHIQISNNAKLIFAFLGKLFGKKVVYTHHNVRVANKTIFKYLLKLCNHIILVNINDLDYKLSANELRKISEIPAFIAPVESEPLPNEIEKVISENDFIVCSNSTEDIYFNGKLTYGYDILIEAFSGFIKKRNENKSKLLLIDPSGKLKQIVEELISLFCDDEVKRHIIYYSNKVDFAGLIKKSAVIVRSTRTDGDALTVREALYFNIPVIASDCTKRPENTILFKNENPSDLELKLIDVCRNRIKFQSHTDDYFDNIISVYNKLI